MHTNTAQTKKQRAYQKGVWAEMLAAGYLWFKGYKIRAWRYKTPVGEIDLIAENKDNLVIVEVKARQHVDDAINAVTPKNQKRVTRAALYFLGDQKETSLPIRFDVIGICGVFSIKHLANAWQTQA